MGMGTYSTQGGVSESSDSSPVRAIPAEVTCETRPHQSFYTLTQSFLAAAAVIRPGPPVAGTARTGQLWLGVVASLPLPASPGTTAGSWSLAQGRRPRLSVIP